MQLEDDFIFTLCSNQYDWNFGTISKVGHFRVIIINGIEARFVFQTKDKYNGINPSGKLKWEMG